MKIVEKTAKTVDDAIMEALIELGATTDEVDIEILDKGSKGFLGFGAKNAKVSITLKTKEETIETIREFKVSNMLKEESNQKETKKQDKGINEDENSEKVMKFLTNVLKEMNIEAELVSKIIQERLYIDIKTEKTGIIIGKRGDTLDAIQYLCNIIANRGKQDYIKVNLDTANYRERREETLRKLAYKLAKKATQTKKPVALEPMNPYDRRIIHSALQNSKSVKTHSEGKEPYRKVVITPSYQSKAYK